MQVSGSGNKWEPKHQKQLVLFRVIQECFQNVIKHANATKVDVVFTYLPDRFEVSISDNGVGFNYQPGNIESDGLGLINIFSRVQLVGGEASLESMEGKGCSVFICVPYNEFESQT